MGVKGTLRRSRVEEVSQTRVQNILPEWPELHQHVSKNSRRLWLFPLPCTWPRLVCGVFFFFERRNCKFPANHVYNRQRIHIKPWPWELGGSQDRVVSKRVVLEDLPLYQKPGTRLHLDAPLYQNQNEGTIAKTALLRNCPFVSS